MHWANQRERYRAVLAGGECVHPGSVFDPISARIAEDLGFEVGMFAGSVASLTVLGAPDLIVLTLSEFAAQAQRICRAGRLPLMVDADHGYGNALNVMRTVQELETAGVAALTIEDTDLPQSFGTVGKTRLLPLDEGVGKMRAALAARQDPTLTIIGRTSAPAVAGLDETIARARAYEAAGVDALFFVGMTSRAEIEAVRDAVTLPLMLGTATGELRDRAWLGGNRVRVCLVGHQPIMAAIKTVHDTLKAIRDGASPDTLPGLPSKELVDRVTRDADYRRWMGEYLGGG
ncbi:MAG: oxaloacetate decarboxylase [Alphaproteobacteria bacterium]